MEPVEGGFLRAGATELVVAFIEIDMLGGVPFEN